MGHFVVEKQHDHTQQPSKHLCIKRSVYQLFSNRCNKIFEDRVFARTA